MTTEDLVLIIGAYSAFVLGAFGLLIKFVLDARKQATEANNAVNNVPKSEPTLRRLVENIDDKVDRLRDANDERHRSNVVRIDRNVTHIDRLGGAIEASVQRLDRIADAVAGANSRIESVESTLKAHMKEVAIESGLAAQGRSDAADDRDIRRE